MAVDRKPIIQKILDEIEPGWIVVLPQGPGYIDNKCILQKPAEYKEAIVGLPIGWFEYEDWDKIRSAIERAVKTAVVKG